MFNEQVRPIAVSLVEKKVPAGTDEEVVKQLVDDLCARINDTLVRGLTEVFDDNEMTQFEQALDAGSSDDVQKLLMLPKVQTMMRDVVVRFTASYSQTAA